MLFVQYEGRRACSEAGVVLDVFGPAGADEELQRVQHQLFVRLLPDKLFVQRLWLCCHCGPRSTAAVPRSVSSIGLLLHHHPLHPHSHTQTLQFILGVISSGVCRSGAGFTAERCSSSSRSPLIFALQSLALSPPAGLKQLEKQPSIVFSILKMFPP